MPCFLNSVDEFGHRHGLGDFIAQLLGDGRRRAGRGEQAEIIVHDEILVAGLRHGRHVWQRLRALGAGHGEADDVAAFHLADLDRHGVEHGVDVAAEQIGERSGGALVRHVDDGDTRAQPQQFGGEIKRAAGAAAGAEGELAGVRLAVGDEIADGLERRGLARHQNKRPIRHFGHRRHIGEIERIVLVERLGDDDARRDHEQRVAVRRRAGQFAQRRLEGGARLVLDIDIGVQAIGQLLRDQPRGDVGGAAGDQADDDADRLVGEILRSRRIRQHQRAAR